MDEPWVSFNLGTVSTENRGKNNLATVIPGKPWLGIQLSHGSKLEPWLSLYFLNRQQRFVSPTISKKVGTLYIYIHHPLSLKMKSRDFVNLQIC